MPKFYFNPGCGVSLYKPEAAEKILRILNIYFGPVDYFTTCCKREPDLPSDSMVICDCAGCTRRFASLYEGVKSIALYEVLSSCEGLPLPDYNRIKMSVQDPCYFRTMPKVHHAVRGLLQKMNIEVIDSKYSAQKSICCGEKLLSKLPIEKVIEKQRERCMQFPCDDVAVYCTTCKESVAAGGKKPHHLIDLMLGEETVTTGLRIDEYHKCLGEYVQRTQFPGETVT